MDGNKEDLIFNQIKVSYPELNNSNPTTLYVEDISLIEATNQVRVTAKTEKGVLTILHLQKTP